MARKPRKTALDEKQIEQILEMVAAGHGYRAIAAETGLSKSYIGKLAAKYDVKPHAANVAAAQPAIDAQRSPSTERIEARLHKADARLAIFGELFDRAHQYAAECDTSNDFRNYVKTLIDIHGQILLLEGRAIKITETRTATITVVDLVRMVEARMGRQLPGEVIDAIGEIE